MTISHARRAPPPGLVVGGRGGPEDECLDDGQEEVFARSEVELGRIEHGPPLGNASDECLESAPAMRDLGSVPPDSP